MGRFEYVKYDVDVSAQSDLFKSMFENIEMMINCLEDGRSKALALTKLEETFMWVGKTLRDQQLQRNQLKADIDESNKARALPKV